LIRIPYDADWKALHAPISAFKCEMKSRSG
jgi:hypothetical protein